MFCFGFSMFAINPIGLEFWCLFLFFKLKHFTCSFTLFGEHIYCLNLCNKMFMQIMKMKGSTSPSPKCSPRPQMEFLIPALVPRMSMYSMQHLASLELGMQWYELRLSLGFLLIVLKETRFFNYLTSSVLIESHPNIWLIPELLRNGLFLYAP